MSIWIVLKALLLSTLSTTFFFNCSKTSSVTSDSYSTASELLLVVYTFKNNNPCLVRMKIITLNKIITFF